MMIIRNLVARASQVALPQGCKPFSLSDTVCVGDLIAILACSISGLGFFFWAIHAVHKMRHEFPFNYREEDQVMPVQDPPFYVPTANDNSILARQGFRKSPTVPDRVKTRMFFTYPADDFHSQTAFIPPDAYDTSTKRDMPRPPPRAGGQSKRTSSHHRGRYASPSRIGSSGDYDISPSGVRGSLDGGHWSHNSMQRLDVKSTMYAR